MNTASRGNEADELASAEALGRWLSRRGLLDAGTELDDDDWRRAIAVRRGLHALVMANTGAAVVDDDVRRLERATATARFQLSFDADGSVAVMPASRSFDDALGALLGFVAVARFEGLWPRFKACARSDCRRVFFDAARSRSTKWCSRRCGERVRKRARRRRENS